VISKKNAIARHALLRCSGSVTWCITQVPHIIFFNAAWRESYLIYAVSLTSLTALLFVAPRSYPTLVSSSIFVSWVQAHYRIATQVDATNSSRVFVFIACT
jgi:hypothetical protein